MPSDPAGLSSLIHITFAFVLYPGTLAVPRRKENKDAYSILLEAEPHPFKPQMLMPPLNNTFSSSLLRLVV